VTPVLAAENVFKRFVTTQALDDVSLDVRRAEVHALVGENGAGKSTLIKLFGGICEPDSGRLLFEGREVRFESPADALAAGIAVIAQELRVVPALSVAENVMLGHLPRRAGTVDWRRTRELAGQALARLHLALDPAAPAGALSFAGRQSVAIARALSRDARVLILDEPTAALEAREVEALFEVLERLKSQGVAIIYVSHRLEEVGRIADRCTVMRDGRVVASLERGTFGVHDLVVHMTGRAIDTEYHAGSGTEGDTLLIDERDERMSVRAGAIMGLAGLLGSGTTQLLRRLFGAERGGRLRLRGARLEPLHPSDAIRAGIGMVPNERALGLVMSLSVRDNIVLPNLRRYSALWRMDERAIDAVVRQLVEALDIRPRDPRVAVRALSGGNQQKVVLAKWLAGRVSVLLLDEPTQGIDVAAKAQLHRLIREFAVRGNAVIFTSSEMHELLSLADGVVAMRDEAITARLERGSGLTERAVRAALHAQP
jgi:ABC-type sugar transport system ATPase subunit